MLTMVILPIIRWSLGKFNLRLSNLIKFSLMARLNVGGH